jgi:hypothetical protein
MFLSHRKQFTKPNRFTQFKEKVALYSDEHEKHK